MYSIDGMSKSGKLLIQNELPLFEEEEKEEEEYEYIEQ